MRWAALLKGVNLNGRKLPMAGLKALVERSGYSDVMTLLGSGNVVFSSNEAAAAIETELRRALDAYGLATDVVVRTAENLRSTVTANPFAGAARDRPNHLVVVFHREPVPLALLERLLKVYDGREMLVAAGRDLYIDYTDGIGTSKLPQAMAKLKFPKVATARNWNTVVKLADLLDG